MKEKKNLPVGAATIEGKNVGQEGLATWQKFLKEYKDHSSEMDSEQKRAARNMVKRLYKQGRISKDERDDLLQRLQ